MPAPARAPAAASGSTFTGWTGDGTGTGACVVTLDQARSVTATFTANTPPDGDVDGPPDVGAGDLFCGVQHRGKFTSGTETSVRRTLVKLKRS